MTDEEQKARWFGLVKEWGASELSIQVFLKQRAISHSTFYRWRIRYEQEHLTRLDHQDACSVFVEATFVSAPDLVDGLSLEHPYRLEEIASRQGVPIARSTMAS